MAKATAQRLTAETLFTQVGAIIGTPAYMSPEQADSTGVDVDTVAIEVARLDNMVVNNGAVSPALRAFFLDTFPAIVTSDGKQAVAVHADYSLLTSQNPVARISLES